MSEFKPHCLLCGEPVMSVCRYNVGPYHFLQLYCHGASEVHRAVSTKELTLLDFCILEAFDEFY